MTSIARNPRHPPQGGNRVSVGVKPTTGGNSDLDKFRASRPDVPPVIKPKPWGHPPPPPKPKRPVCHHCESGYRVTKEKAGF